MMYQFKENIVKRAWMASFFLLLSLAGWAGNHTVVMTGYSDGVITTGSEVEGNWTVTFTDGVQDLAFTEEGGLQFTLPSSATLTMTSVRTFTGKLESIQIPEFAENANLDIAVYADGKLLGSFSYINNYIFESSAQVISFDGSQISLVFSGANAAVGAFAGGGVTVSGLKEVSIQLGDEETGLRFSKETSEFVIGSGTNALPDDCYGYDEVTLEADVLLSQLIKKMSFKYSTPGVAEVQDDGTVKILAAGQTTITASYSGSDDYSTAEAEYDLTVTLAMPHFNEREDSIYFPGQKFSINFSNTRSTLSGVDTYYGYANEGSTQYTAPFEVSRLGHSEVDAYNKLGDVSSDPTVAHYFVYEKPVFSLLAGSYQGEQELTFTSLPEGETLSGGAVLEPQVYYFFDDDKDQVFAYTADKVISISESVRVSAYIQMTYNGLVLRSDTVMADYDIEAQQVMNIVETGLRFSKETSEFVIGSGSDALPEDCYGYQDLVSLEADVPIADLTDGITYESSHPEVAEVQDDGTVKILSPGRTTIIAEYEGSGVYQTSGASYELTVTLVQPFFNEQEDSIYFSDQEFAIGVSDTRYTLRGVETRYFYLDGSTEGETVYKEPFQMSKVGLNEIAADNYVNGYASAETLATYIVLDKPVFSLKAGTYQGEQELTITSLPSKVEGVMPQVYYYFDNDEAHAVAYKEGTVITITESVQVNAYIMYEADNKSIRSGNVTADYVIEAVIEPLEDEKPVTFNNEDFIVEDEEGNKKEADLSNYSVNGILYTLNTSVDGEGYDGSGEEGVICMMTTLTDAQVAAVAGKVDAETYQPGSADYATEFSGGITFLLSAGKGYIELDNEVSQGYDLHMKIGSSDPVDVGSTTRQVVKIPYETEEDVYVYVYLVQKASMSRPETPRVIGRRETAHGRLYSVRCSVSKDPQAEYEGYTKNYVYVDGLVFKRQFTTDDPTGSTCVLIKPGTNVKEVWAKCNSYGQGIGYADPGDNDPEKHVGPDGDEYTGAVYVIPSEPGGYKMVAIDGDAFKGNTHLEGITFPEANLTTIPGSGFEECTALKSLNFKGSSINVIGTAAFAKCTALETIEDWGNVETIHGSTNGFGYGSFGGCTALKELKFGPSVKYIYGNAFGGCTSVTKLYFEDGDDRLELSAGGGNEGGATLMFYDSPITYVYYGRKLTNNATDNYIGFVNPLSTIEESVRKTITKMEVEFGPQIDTLRNCVLREMDMPLYVSAPAATYIGTYAFEKANVKSLDVPKIKCIDKYAFNESTLSEMNFYSVEEIRENAFQNARLVNVSLPATLKYVGSSAFDLNYTSDEANEAGNYDETSSLKTFRIEDGDEPIELGFRRDYYEENKDVTDSDWEISAYSQEWLSSLTLEELYIGRPVAHEPVINEYGTISRYASVLNFSANAFPKLKKVELTKVTMIDDYAFQAGLGENNPQSSLVEVSLPLLTAVPKGSFYNCGKLTTVNIPKAKVLWDEAFAYTSGDLGISFINTVDSIKANCFANSKIGGNLTIPASLKFLGRATFYNCENLKKVTFEYGEKPLGMDYFWASNYAGSGVMSIGGYKCGIEEFYFDRNIEPCTYTDGNGETYTYRFEIAIGDGTANATGRGYPNLKSVTIGKKLTSLDGYSFVSPGLDSIRCENPEPIALEYTTYEDDKTFNADHSQGPSFSIYVQEKVQLLVPEGSVAKYLKADVWKGFVNITDDKGNLGTITITIGENGKTTYCGSHNLDFTNSEARAFIATGFDKDEEIIWMTRIYDVTAEVPVLIKGEPDNYEIPISPTSKASYYMNMFKGVLGDKITIGEEGYNYFNGSTSAVDVVNYYLTGGVFKSVNKSATIGPNKCYLTLPKDYQSNEPGDPVEVTISQYGKTTLMSPLGLDFSDFDDLKAFTVTGYDKDAQIVWLTRILKAPPYTPLVLKGEKSKTYSIPSEKFQGFYSNMLRGNGSESTQVINETDGIWTNYYLNQGQFKKVKNTANIAPGKCWLLLPTSMLAGARAETMDDWSDEAWTYSTIELETETMPIIFGETTGIVSMDNGQWIMDNAPDGWYTLGGQRIDKPTKKGLYIHNGKKVVVR